MTTQEIIMANPYENNPFKKDERREPKSEFEAHRQIKEGVKNRRSDLNDTLIEIARCSRLEI